MTKNTDRKMTSFEKALCWAMIPVGMFDLQVRAWIVEKVRSDRAARIADLRKAYRS